jgi:hypothetical protein
MGIHFEAAKSDIDLSGLVAESNPDSKNPFFISKKWPEEVERFKTLLVPSTGTGLVYVCQNATSMNEVVREN